MAGWPGRACAEASEHRAVSGGQHRADAVPWLRNPPRLAHARYPWRAVTIGTLLAIIITVMLLLLATGDSGRHHIRGDAIAGSA
jgi:hypothetical protein